MYEIIVGRDEEDRKRYGLDGTFLLGKHYVHMGQTTSLSNNVYMDANRSHVVFICGKRGSGKCVTGDTLLCLDDGRLCKISDLEHDPAGVVALNDDMKSLNTPRTGFYKRSVKKLLQIKTRSGRAIKLTPEHPLLSLHGWYPASAFRVGSRLAAPRKLPNFGKGSLPESHIKVLAYLIAEGHVAQGVLFSNTDPVLIEDFSDSISEIDSNTRVARLKEGHYRVYTDNFTSPHHTVMRNSLGQYVKGSRRRKTIVREFLEHHQLYDLKSATKKIPADVMQLQKMQLAIFLRILFSCDGSIYSLKSRNKRHWQISYSSISEELIRQVQHLLLRFGILSTLREKTAKCNGKLFETFELVVSSEHVLTFVEEIGFFGRKVLREQQAKKELIFVKINPNTDTIPRSIWGASQPDNWAAAGRALGYKHPKAFRESSRYAPSRQKMLQLAAYEQDDYLHALATSDIFWDEITSIETLEGKFEVYDLTVPEYHNFVANDIFVHNSYSMGSIVEGMVAMPKSISKNISMIMLDTMGIYWTMKYENKRDAGLLKEWGMKPEDLNVKIYTPIGHFDSYRKKHIPTDAPFSLKPSELSATDWTTTFDIELTDPIGVLIDRVIDNLKKKEADYSLDDVIKAINADKRADNNTQAAAGNLFITAQNWGLFSEEGTAFTDLAVGGQVTVLDVSCYAADHSSTSIRALVIGLVAQKLFDERMEVRKGEEYDAVHASQNSLRSQGIKVKKNFPLVWLVVDEAHEFLPKVGSTPASKSLITILREGRQPGISLILASQQPGQIHTDVMTQSDIVISHRLTAKIDIDALGQLMQSYMREGLDKAINELPRVKGAAILFDDTNERLYPLRVRPRITWHGGSSPVAMRDEKEPGED